MVQAITKDVSLHLGSLQSLLASDFCPIHGQSESELKMPESQGEDKLPLSFTVSLWG